MAINKFSLFRRDNISKTINFPNCGGLSLGTKVIFAQLLLYQKKMNRKAHINITLKNKSVTI